MQIQVGQHGFVQVQNDETDGLEYNVYWLAQVPAPELTKWGQGSEQLGNQPLPIACLRRDDQPPLPRQVAAAKWLLANFAKVADQVQAACEKSWSDCYYWEGNEMQGDEEYFITSIRIPPGETPPWGEQRDPSLPALILVDLEQDWELEHGFYVIIDPATGEGEWTTWDGLEERGLIGEYDEDEDDFDDDDEDDLDDEDYDEDDFDEDDFDDE